MQKYKKQELNEFSYIRKSKSLHVEVMPVGLNKINPRQGHLLTHVTITDKGNTKLLNKILEYEASNEINTSNQ